MLSDGDEGMVQRLAPVGSGAAEIQNLGQPVSLQGGEAIPVQRACRRRQREFALGRDCARRALAQLGVEACDVPVGERGAPQWPEGFIGSISHTDGYAAAVVARREHFRHLGIDAERIGRVTREIAGKLFVSEEMEALARLDGNAWEHMATVLFSAKEAYYKALQGASGPPSFRGLRVALEEGGFAVENDDGARPVRAAGRFLAEKGIVVTVVAVPAP